MTPDARVLHFPSGANGLHAEDYGRFSRELSADELSGCFFFSDDDRRRIAARRRDDNRLGFAVQLGTVRYLGRFLENPAAVPASVLAWTVREIGVAGASLEGYAEGEARWEHQAEIRRDYGYTPFGASGVEHELSLWLRARAWMSAESHRVLFARAAEHLIARRVLLPGYSTLWRLVGAAREHADARGFAMLADTPSSEQRARLQAMLRTPEGRRISSLERLRRPEVQPTIAGLIDGLQRVRELRALADGLGGLEALPVARLRALTVDAERCRPADLAKMSDARRIATLMAFAITGAERGQDDALEQFDRLHGELLLRVKAQSQRERLSDGEALDVAGRTLMEACRVVLDDRVAGPVREAVFAAVQRDRLAAAVSAMERLARSPDDRARELVLTRYRGVRRYLPVREHLGERERFVDLLRPCPRPLWLWQEGLRPGVRKLTAAAAITPTPQTPLAGSAKGLAVGVGEPLALVVVSAQPDEVGPSLFRQRNPELGARAIESCLRPHGKRTSVRQPVARHSLPRAGVVERPPNLDASALKALELEVEAEGHAEGLRGPGG